mmetsp:Transcript_19832/g.51530  ORF Transcript_19832/g.51530 Transcript_19832/m.51530 type:complete len:241 (+) Transcript_19832:925-1647(+)
MCIVRRRPDASPPLAPRDRGEDFIDRRDVHFAAAHGAPVQNPQIVGLPEQVADALVVALDVGHAAPLIGLEDVDDCAGDEARRLGRALHRVRLARGRLAVGDESAAAASQRVVYHIFRDLLVHGGVVRAHIKDVVEAEDARRALLRGVGVSAGALDDGGAVDAPGGVALGRSQAHADADAAAAGGHLCVPHDAQAHWPCSSCLQLDTQRGTDPPCSGCPKRVAARRRPLCVCDAVDAQPW